MSNKYRGMYDFVGFLVLAASLGFVAFQMQQDRFIAQAALNTSQLENYSSRFIAGLESDAYLSMWSKLYSANEWDTTGLSDHEIAAAELDAHIWWNYIEMTFENRRDGLVSDAAWNELESEIEYFLKDFKVYRAVYETYLREVRSDFMEMVEGILKRVESEGGS